MKKTVFFVLSVLLFVSCEIKESKIYSTGKVLDVLVVANHDALSKATNDLIDSILSQPPACFAQNEPRFNKVDLPLDKLEGNKVFQSYRSIVKCDIGKDNPDKVFIERDKWVRPQVYIHISASCEDSLRALLRRYEAQMVKVFYDVERQRFVELYSGSAGNKTIAEKVKKKYGFSIAVGSTFHWLKEQDDFVWIQERLVEKDDKTVLSNLLIQTTPYVSQDQFQKERLLDRLDTMLCRYVPVEPSGYPGIERDTNLIDVQTSYVDYPGAKYCIYTRGWWGLKGTDFMMGGPIVAYSILSPDGKTIVDVVGFIYARNHKKRDFLMKLESMCYSVRW